MRPIHARAPALGILLLPAASARAEKTGTVLDALNGSDEVAKLRYGYYLAGVIDGLMYATDWIRQTGRTPAVCFPRPTPSRDRIVKEFLEHVERASGAVGAPKIRDTAVDQLMLAGWLLEYPCPK
jgi:hypothetical protein